MNMLTIRHDNIICLYNNKNYNISCCIVDVRISFVFQSNKEKISRRKEVEKKNRQKTHKLFNSHVYKQCA